ncbi:MAG: PrsW family intramembrane metalloprotease [Methanopyri archaeon]|nr:PrsW family intramembrane metalloprotease [Methanopyri archaeon]
MTVPLIGVALGLLYSPMAAALSLVTEILITKALIPTVYPWISYNPLTMKVITASIVAPVVEEGFKAAGFLVIPTVLAAILRWFSGVSIVGKPLATAAEYIDLCRKDVLGAVCTAGATALGFSMIENALYTLAAFKMGGPLASLLVGAFRTVISTPMHIVSTVSFALMYTYVARARWWGIPLGYTVAALIHGAFNYTVLSVSYHAQKPTTRPVVVRPTPAPQPHPTAPTPTPHPAPTAPAPPPAPAGTQQQGGEEVVRVIVRVGGYLAKALVPFSG